MSIFLPGRGGLDGLGKDEVSQAKTVIIHAVQYPDIVRAPRFIRDRNGH